MVSLVIKRGGLKLHMGKVMFVEELWNFAKKTSLEGDSINLVLLLESPFTPPLIDCPHLLFLSLVYHETNGFAVESTCRLFFGVASSKSAQPLTRQAFIQVLS